MSVLRVEGRFCGPPGLANGGYVAGCLASELGAAGRQGVRVTLREGVPLDRDHTIVREGEAIRLTHGDTLLVEARPQALDFDVPAPPDPDAVLAVEARCRAFETHPFPRCFVCGPERDDGLRILPGPLGEGVAARFAPGADLADPQRLVRTAHVWAALDCPTVFPLLEDPEAQKLEPMVLGQITARIDGRPPAGEPCWIAAWQMGLEGRRGRARAALYGPEGQVLARAEALWFSLAGRD